MHFRLVIVIGLMAFLCLALAGLTKAEDYDRSKHFGSSWIDEDIQEEVFIRMDCN